MAKIPVADMQGKPLSQLAEEDPDLMRLWGEINNAWDEIERLLYTAFDAMLSEETSFATQAIFYSQRSHAARRAMVESLAKYALLNRPQTAKKLENAIRRVRARSNDRHKITHGTWAYAIDLKTNETGLNRMALEANFLPDLKSVYPRKRLIEVRDNMRSTANAFREAIEPIDAAKRAKATELGAKHMEKAKLLEGPPSS